MFISFTGAQSSGKSTLFNHFISKNTEWEHVPEVTRKFKRIGFSINDDADNYDDTQLAIFADHISNLLSKYNEKNTILDRCLVDGYIYTRYFRHNSKVTEFIDKMFSYAMPRYIPMYDYIFYTNPYDVPLVDDGERSTKVKFREDIIKLYEDKVLDKYPNVYVLEGTVEDRYNKMKEIIGHGKIR